MSEKPRAAVMQFPGVNCEYESVRALDAAGAAAEIVRWNADPALLAAFDLFLLPGGFSYQDRVRAGAVAARDSVLDALAVEAERGKPILGICNGAQVLVETGLVPGLEGGQVALALAPNRMPGREGYFSRWSWLRVSGNTPSWLASAASSVLPIPFAHGEGRFTSRREGLLEDLAERGQIVLSYCREDGAKATLWPENPNGSALDAAGICNREGNVLAMMPHPERAAWLGQVPEDLGGEWGRKRALAHGDWQALRSPGPGMGLLVAMVEAAAECREVLHAT